MSGISSRRVRYAIGLSANWTASVMTEGFPAADHFVFEPVHDRTSGHVTTDELPGVDIESYQIGTQYYIASPSIHFRPSHAKFILDSLFQNTIVGAGPNYIRNYVLEDAPAIPSSKIFTMQKNTAKTGHDYVQVYAGGVITSITFSQDFGQAMKFSFRAAFCHKTIVSGIGASALWNTNMSDGNQDISRLADMTFLFGDPSSPAAYYFSSWSLTLSYEAEPKFWANQEPDSIVRSKPSISGEFTLRDKTSEVEDMEERIRDSEPSRLLLLRSGSLSINVNVVLHAGTGREDDVKRYGHFNFTGVKNESASTKTPLSISLTPGRT